MVVSYHYQEPLDLKTPEGPHNDIFVLKNYYNYHVHLRLSP